MIPVEVDIPNVGKSFFFEHLLGKTLFIQIVIFILLQL